MNKPIIADANIVEALAILEKIPTELYALLSSELAEILMRRDGLKLEYLPPDEFGNENFTKASTQAYIGYQFEAESILEELKILQEET